MMISTRGRYALRVMVDIAEQQQKEGYIALKGIADRQNISQKYIESIMTTLSKAGFLDSAHGKGGGYRLNREPKDYKVLEILTVTEGTLAPVACLECNAPDCKRKNDCRTIGMWNDLNNTINNFFDSYSIADLMKK